MYHSCFFCIVVLTRRYPAKAFYVYQTLDSIGLRSKYEAIADLRSYYGRVRECALEAWACIGGDKFVPAATNIIP